MNQERILPANLRSKKVSSHHDLIDRHTPRISQHCGEVLCPRYIFSQRNVLRMTRDRIRVEIPP